MDDYDIEIKILNILSDYFAVDLKNINRTDTLNDIGIDSLNKAELIMSLEDIFDIDIPNEEENLLKTVDDIINYVKGKV